MGQRGSISILCTEALLGLHCGMMRLGDGLEAEGRRRIAEKHSVGALPNACQPVADSPYLKQQKLPLSATRQPCVRGMLRCAARGLDGAIADNGPSSAAEGLTELELVRPLLPRSDTRDLHGLARPRTCNVHDGQRTPRAFEDGQCTRGAAARKRAPLPLDRGPNLRWDVVRGHVGGNP